MSVPTWSPVVEQAARSHLSAVPDNLPPRRYTFTDLGNAEAWVDLHRTNFRFVKDRRRWLSWRDGRWRDDATGEAERAGKEMARELLTRAVKLDEGDEQRRAIRWALDSQSARRIKAMLELAGTEPEIVLSADGLDRDPFLLACANGTVDLRTGELRKNARADLISLGTDVFFDSFARAPRWLQFLDEVFGGDKELVGFVRRACGYALTGSTREHVLFVLHGAGCNGKTTFVETLKRLLGDLAQTTPFDSMVRARGSRGVPNDVARLHRARLVVAAESGEGRRLDEALVKVLTGGDTVAARFLYGEYFEFRPAFKLLLVTNHRPRVDGDDDAIWRRLRLIPFEVSFQGREDREISGKLKSELPGILAWAVQGCLEWQREGLGLPPAVERATAEYRQDEDVLGAFIAEQCLLEGSVEVADFRTAYERYCRELGEKPIAASWLSRRLGQRGIELAKSGGTRLYRGLSLSSG